MFSPDSHQLMPQNLWILKLTIRTQKDDSMYTSVPQSVEERYVAPQQYVNGPSRSLLVPFLLAPTYMEVVCQARKSSKTAQRTFTLEFFLRLSMPVALEACIFVEL